MERGGGEVERERERLEGKTGEINTDNDRKVSGSSPIRSGRIKKSSPG